MNKEEYIKHKKEQFEKNLESAFDENNLYVVIFTDNQQSSCYGHYEHCDMYCGCDNTWRDNKIRFGYTGIPLSQMITLFYPFFIH